MNNSANKTGNQGIQVIARAASILHALKDSSHGLSLGQIAAKVGLPRSTVQRIISALLAERLVMLATPEGGFRLGPEIQSLALAGRVPVVEIVHPYIAELSRETGETVDLAELRHDHMVFIDQIVGNHRLRTVATVGEEFPLVSTANGKASLAMLDDEQVIRLAENEMGSRKRLPVFMQEIAQIRNQGLAYDMDEHSKGISALGAAFVDVNEQVYSISIPVPTPRFIERKEQLSKQLLNTVQRFRSLLDR